MLAVGKYNISFIIRSVFGQHSELDSSSSNRNDVTHPNCDVPLGTSYPTLAISLHTFNGFFTRIGMSQYKCCDPSSFGTPIFGTSFFRSSVIFLQRSTRSSTVLDVEDDCFSRLESKANKAGGGHLLNLCIKFAVKFINLFFI